MKAFKKKKDCLGEKMKNKEFYIFFIPMFAIGALFIYLPFILQIIFPFNLIPIIIGILFLIVDIFALLVQYVNWRYYKEE